MARTKKTDEHEQQVETAKESETAYSRDNLRAHSLRLFHVTPEVFDGALYGSQKTELTITEVKKKIKSFLEREVK